LDKAEWRIPESRMKASKEHRVPLCPRAVDVLIAVQKINGNKKLVFITGQSLLYLRGGVFFDR